MAASKKAIENSKRVRYVRALERFCKSVASYLSNSDVDLTKEQYDKRVEKSLKIYERVEEVSLYKGDLQDLQKIVKKIIFYKESTLSIEEIKRELLYSLNQLQKSKNARRYKKEKHANKKYEEWE